MPDPMSRKLFRSREAREKLRGMGGIMASSPELAQTVARFADGGPTELQIPRVRSAIQEGGMSYPSYRMMSRSQREALGYPVSEIGGQLAFDRFGVGLGLVDPASRFSPSGLNVSELRTDAAGPVDEFSGLTPYMTEPSGTVDIPQAGQGVFPGDLAFDLGEAVGFGPALKAAGVEDPVVARQRRMEEEAAALEAEAAAAREAVAATMETEAEAGDAETRNVDRLREAQERALEELRRKSEDADGGAGGAAEFDFDTTYEQMLERVGRVMGEGTKKDDREKAMANLAMIGLAIAAGQSPNALTNIAQGALSGMQAMRAQEAREADLAREARLTALEMAESAADRASEERIAAIRAGGSDEATRQEFLYNETFNTTYNSLVNDRGLDHAEAVIIARQRATEAAPNAPSARAAGAASVTVPTTAVTPEQAQQIRSRISAAKGDANQLASIRQSLTLRGINPADYGL